MGKVSGVESPRAVAESLAETLDDPGALRVTRLVLTTSDRNLANDGG
jgi:hypothetical protein